MGNYHYIVAGLPDLMLDFKTRQFSYEEVKNSVYSLCSESDQKLIDVLEQSFSEDNIDAALFEKAALSKNDFIKNYFSFDKQFRNLKVMRLAKKLSVKPDRYFVGEVDEDFEDKDKINSLLNEENVIERERSLDKYVWDKVNDITTFNYFDIDNVLAFLVKAHITDRWCKMDKAKGAEFFKLLVNEVRGTFKGVQGFNA